MLFLFFFSDRRAAHWHLKICENLIFSKSLLWALGWVWVIIW